MKQDLLDLEAAAGLFGRRLQQVLFHAARKGYPQGVAFLFGLGLLKLFGRRVLELLNELGRL
jgi:hypothetical protein